MPTDWNRHATEVVDLTRSYLRLPAVVGFEDPFARHLADTGRAPELSHFPAAAPVSYEPLCEAAGEEVWGQLDNCLSAALATVLCRLGFRGRVVLTREEEIGRSWQYLLDDLERAGDGGPLLVLDTSPFDEAEFPAAGSLVLRTRDANGEFDAALDARLRASAAGAQIPVLVKDEWLRQRARERGEDEAAVRLGSTELGRLVRGSGGAFNGATVQIPTRGYHTNRESASLAGIRSALQLLAAVLGFERPE